MGLISKIRSFLGASTPTADVVSDGESRWWSGNSWSATGAAGEDVDQDSMMRSATVFACSKVLSETIAGLPGCTYLSGVGSKSRTRGSNDQPLELLNDQPNPEMDSYTFWEMLVTRMVNRGNFFAEIERNNRDEPIALWPIHNSRVQPMRDSDGSLYYRISTNYAGSPRYDDPSWRDANTFELSPHNMLNMVGFGSSNGVMAPGMLPGAEEISMDFASRRYGGGFFNGGATPSGMVQHPGFIDDPNKRKIFRDDLNLVHNNKTGGSKIGVLWQGATYSQVSVSPEQAQFLETRKFTADQICKFYGVPPAIIGDYEHSKFATADAMIRSFVMLTLRNLAVRIEKGVNRQILKVRNDRGRLERAFTKPLIYEIALDGLLRGDPASQATVIKTLRDTGALSTNEVREEFDWNPIDGPEGEYRIVPGGYSRLDKIDEQGTRGANKAQEKATEALDAARERLAEGLRSVIATLPAQSVSVQGHTPEPEVVETTKAIPSEVLTETAVSVAEAEIARIHKITTTQIERWREQDPAEVAQKLEGFFVKQKERLADALRSCDLIQNTVNPTGPKVSTALSGAYFQQFETMDNYSIFDSTQTAPRLNITEEVRRCFS